MTKASMNKMIDNGMDGMRLQAVAIVVKNLLNIEHLVYKDGELKWSGKLVFKYHSQYGMPPEYSEEMFNKGMKNSIDEVERSLDVNQTELASRISKWKKDRKRNIYK